MNRHKNSVAFSMNISLSFKILVVGNRNAGKTSLIIRYIKDIFDFNYKVTIGVEFYSKILQIGTGNGEENEEIALQIWDTSVQAGGDNYKSVVRSFYNFAHCALLLYDSHTQCEDMLENWLREVRENMMAGARLVVVRTKIDINSMSKEEEERVGELGNKYGVDFFMAVSAKNNNNVNQLFFKLATHLNNLHKTDEQFRKLVDQKNDSVLLTSSEIGSCSKKKKKNCC